MEILEISHTHRPNVDMYIDIEENNIVIYLPPGLDGRHQQFIDAIRQYNPVI
ncbi:11074_t:CDS:1, partial [Racocetra fulgida]